jgi:uncharacterized protein YebE (UPF0316 family)
MFNYIILVIIKIVDNLILTAKTITTYKGLKIISAVLTVVSQFMFYFVISKVLDDDTMTTIIIVSISSGVGTYLAFIINQRFKKDAKWTNLLTCTDIEDIKKLCDVLRENKIKYIVNDSYSRSWSKTYSITAFAKTKYESIIIDNYLSSTSVKYLREILKD